MSEEVVGIDHVFITVGDMGTSEAFYDRLFGVLAFRKESLSFGSEAHIHYYNRHFGYCLRPSRKTGASHDPYSPGLHHLCFRVSDDAAVERSVRALAEVGIEASEPRLYPEYAMDYYATFLSDPDGVRLEIRSFGTWRKHQMHHW